MKKIGCMFLLVLIAAALTFFPSCGFAATDDSDTSLAKQAQNPVAKLISVPLQNNFNFGIGPNNAPSGCSTSSRSSPSRLMRNGTSSRGR